MNGAFCVLLKPLKLYFEKVIVINLFYNLYASWSIKTALRVDSSQFDFWSRQKFEKFILNDSFWVCVWKCYVGCLTQEKP